MPHKKPTFSIIIPTLNEEKYLPHLLRDLSMQTFTDFEVIVVDGKSKDKTLAATSKVKKKLVISVLHSPIANVARQRNLGAKKSQGNWLLFIDADTRIPCYFLEGIKYQLSKEPATDIFTSLLAADESASTTILFAQTFNLSLLFAEKTAKQFAFGAFMGGKREVFKKVFFDETILVGEDSHLIRSAVKLGFTFKIFKEPQYVYSFRRLRKEGLLRMLAIDAKAVYKELLDQKLIDNDYGYVMLGGDYYDDSPKATRIKSVHKAVRLTKQQIKRLNDFFKKLS